MTRPIAYVARFVPEYRQPILEKLNEQLDGRLIVCAGSVRDPSFQDLSRGPAPSYRRIDLKNRWIRNHKALIQNSHPVFACDPIVILAEESPRTISLPWLLATARLKRIGTLLWGHFSSNRRAFSNRNLLDRYRLTLAKQVDGCICYTDEIADLIRPHVPDERCFIARNTLDTDKLFQLHKTLGKEGKERVRARLGLPVERKTIVFIGRLIADKRPEVLLKLHKVLCTVEKTTLIIIGDGPERNRLMTQARDEDLKNVFFPGALTEIAESASWMYAADVMVCPGYVGLNVNHAFCLGLPVVTCSSPDPRIRYHSPEIAYLKAGVNSMLAPYDDLHSLVEATLMVFENQQSFSSQAYEYAQSHLQVKGMIDGLVQAIEYAESCASKKIISLGNP